MTGVTYNRFRHYSFKRHDFHLVELFVPTVCSQCGAKLSTSNLIVTETEDKKLLQAGLSQEAIVPPPVASTTFYDGGVSELCKKHLIASLNTQAYVQSNMDEG